MADWDTNSPEDSDIVSQYPANARAARDAVRTNFGVDHHEENDADVGKHEVIQLVDQAGDATIGADDIGIWNDAGVLKFRIGAGAVSQVAVHGELNAPTGTKMLFHQAAAPTGWTQDATVNDRVLRVVSGAGGGNGGSWTISGVTVDGHTLTVAQMPSHNHGGSTGNTAPTTNTTGAHSHGLRGGGSSGGSRIRESSSNNSMQSTQSAGAHSHTVASHGHSISSQGGGESHNHGLTADGNWRPSYTDVIVAEKD